MSNSQTYTGPVYSPTQTLTWLECPLKWWLVYKQGWRPRQLGKKELAGLVGSALHAGLATYYRGRIKSCQPAPDAPQPLPGGRIHQALLSAQACLREEREGLGGYVWQEDCEIQLEGLSARVERLVTKFATQDPIPRTWHVRDVELSLPEHGWAKLDLALEDESGLAILDWKYKGSLDSRYRGKELARYKSSWQMRHYTWAYSQVVGMPVTRYYIGLVVGEPFSVSLNKFEVGPEDSAMWLQSAQRVWAQMAQGNVWMVGSHETVYGPCEYQRACLDFRLDENLMRTEYERRGK